MSNELYTKIVEGVYKNIDKKNLFLQSFFKPVVLASEKIQIDSFIRKSLVFPDVQICDPAIIKNGREYRALEVSPPAFKVEETWDCTQAFMRRLGKNSDITSLSSDDIWGISAAVQRLRVDLDNFIEVQASGAIFDGKIILYSDETIDYKRNAENTITQTYPTDANGWLTLLNSLSALVAKNEGNPDTIIMGNTALSSFLGAFANDKRFDSLRVNIGEIELQKQGSTGGFYAGIINISGIPVSIFGYDRKYILAPQTKSPTAGQSTPFVPPNSVAILDKNSEMKKVFGGLPYVSNIGLETRALESRILTHLDDYNSCMKVKIESRPLLIPVFVNQIAVANLT